jgi:2-amino-4-hydroxy-6-hydroxymethyldihydropteridine diphosphokinase
MESPLITAYIALGANLGDRAANLATAVDCLRGTGSVEVVKVSHSYETAAVGGPTDSPPYLNAAAELRTSLPAMDLLARLLEIEREIGRVRREKWEPRPIDLDLLLYDDQIIATDVLLVPHPLMHERRFVLGPLAEIAPDVVHPVLQKSMKGLLEAL